MKKLDPPKKLASTADAMEQERDLHEAGFAAEYERLEAQLGAGMTSIVEVPFTHKTPATEENTEGHKRGLSNSKVLEDTVKDAQKEAEKTGGIVAAEIPVDISDLAGGSNDFETRSVLTTGHGDNGDSQTSYFFPPGKLASRILGRLFSN